MICLPKSILLYKRQCTPAVPKHKNDVAQFEFWICPQARPNFFITTLRNTWDINKVKNKHPSLPLGRSDSRLSRVFQTYLPSVMLCRSSWGIPTRSPARWDIQPSSKFWHDVRLHIWIISWESNMNLLIFYRHQVTHTLHYWWRFHKAYLKFSSWFPTATGLSSIQYTILCEAAKTWILSHLFVFSCGAAAASGSTLRTR